MATVVAHGISRKKIRAFTKYVRELCGMTDRLYFPVVEFLEIILPNLIDDFTYEIVEHSEMPDAFLVENAEFDGYIELPVIKTSDKLPKTVVTFSKAMTKSWTDFDCWVVFYEHDKEFERLWNNPKQYLDKLKKFKGVISPDFSLYRNMPLVMQMWNTYRGRALAVWLQNNGIEIIPNVRTADVRTFRFAFKGVESHKTVAIGTHGCIKRKEDKAYFKNGLAELVKRLSPKTIIVYGAAPDDIFKVYEDMGINIIVFESEFAKSRKQVTA